MSHPFAFCTGLFINYGVQVWDMVKQVKIRSVPSHPKLLYITNGNELLN